MFGAYDMGGNLWEWVAWWGVAGKGGWLPKDGDATKPWPTSAYGGDSTHNVDGRGHNGDVWTNGIPVAVLRGGNYAGGTSAGIFSIRMNYGPSAYLANTGARCCRR